jgi:hypothetical protein
LPQSAIANAADRHSHAVAGIGHADLVQAGDNSTLDELVAMARRAVALVEADVRRTTSECPRIVVEPWTDSGVCIKVNDGFTAPSMWSTSEQAAVAEMADYVQEQLDGELGCWPVCNLDEVGLHAEVRDGAAVWRCRLGDHTVARIGELGLTQ